MGVMQNGVIMKFYSCKHCGNIVAYVENKGPQIVCCGEVMKELIPGSVDAAVEKHKPVITVDGNKVVVTVGSVLHPMQEEHYIQWIVLETKEGKQRKKLVPSQEPQAHFMIVDGDEVVAAYAYCNLHGLWT